MYSEGTGRFPIQPVQEDLAAYTPHESAGRIRSDKRRQVETDDQHNDKRRRPDHVGDQRVTAAGQGGLEFVQHGVAPIFNRI